MANNGDQPVACKHGTRLQVTLADFFLLLAATCCVLGFEQWRLKTAEISSDAFAWHFNVRLLFIAPLDAACIVALIKCVPWCSPTRQRFPTQPGHWILVIEGALYSLGATQQLLNQLVGEARLEGLPAWLSAAYGSIAWLVAAALALVAARLYRSQTLFCLAFLAIATSCLMPVVHTALFFGLGGRIWILNSTFWGAFSRVVFSLPAVFAVAATIRYWSSTQNDLWHFIGVGVLLLRIAAEWPVWFSWLYLFG